MTKSPASTKTVSLVIASILVTAHIAAYWLNGATGIFWAFAISAFLAFCVVLFIAIEHEAKMGGPWV